MAESDIEKDRFLAEHADFRFREQVSYRVQTVNFDVEFKIAA